MRKNGARLLIAVCVGLYSTAGAASVFAQGLTIKTVAGDNMLVNGQLPPPGYNGDNRQAIGARLDTPIGVAIDGAGNIYIADTLNHRIRKVTRATGLISTVAGTGVAGYNGDNIPATQAQVNSPTGLAVDTAGNLFIADQSNNRIRKINTSGIITTVVGNGQNNVYRGENGPAVNAQICYPYSVVVDGAGNLFVSDSGNHAVRKVAASTQVITTVVPGVAMCGLPGAFGGDGGPANSTAAKLNSPQGIAVNSAGTNLFIADTHNSRIRKVVVGGIITTVAGSGPSGTGPNGGACPVINYNGDNRPATTALLNWPHSVDVDASGNLFIADYCNYRIRKVTPAGTITTVAGNGASGWDGDNGSSTVSYISDPTDVRVDSAGDFYIVDQATNRVRKVFPTPAATDTAPLVTQNPSDQFASPGATATFQASSSGTPAATVQWQVSTNGGSSFSNLAGQTGNILSFGAVLADNGKRYRAVFTNALGSAATTAALLTVRASAAIPKTDFDGDAIGDLTVWRPANGTWFTLTSSGGYNYSNMMSHQWGTAGDMPLIGDMDGDRIADLIVWRPSNGTWYWLSSSTGYSVSSFNARQWGNNGLGDVPMLGDIDGDGRMDLVLWRASSGTWFWLTSSSGFSTFGSKQWGSQSAGDIPKLGDVDGDGRSDLMVWRGPTGTWFWLTSSTGYNTANSGLKQFGNQTQGDVPLVGDFDGDGRSELAVWRASSGTWYWLMSTTGYASGSGIQWGNQGAGDIPLLTDLDGDGKVDLTVWRASTGTWFWLKSLQGYSVSGMKQWGSQSLGDIPMVK